MPHCSDQLQLSSVDEPIEANASRQKKPEQSATRPYASVALSLCWPNNRRRKFTSGNSGWRKAMRVKAQVAVAVVVGTAIASTASTVDSGE
jgi:hypothetical protein